MLRPRTRSRRKLNPPPVDAEQVHPIGTPTSGISTNTGPLAAAAWLVDRELAPPSAPWTVEIVFAPADSDLSESRFHLEIYSEEWGFRFFHGGQTSWIRVTDIPFVHGRDDHELLRETPKLRSIGQLITAIENRYGVKLSREPKVTTNLADAEAKIREWVAQL